MSSFIWCESANDLPAADAWVSSAHKTFEEGGGLLMKANGFTPVVQRLVLLVLVLLVLVLLVLVLLVLVLLVLVLLVLVLLVLVLLVLLLLVLYVFLACALDSINL